jgi:hypothetical protein
MKAILIKREDGYNLRIEQPQGRLLEATCSPSQQLILNKSGVSTKYKLSKQNCDEIFGIVDVEKLFNEVDETIDFHEFCFSSFKLGVNKAMELNKDKQFTLDDIRMAIVYGERHRDMDAGKIPYQPFFEFIPSLQQPTEIEVEIEMETCSMNPLDLDCNEIIKRPKLDSDGYLILKQL